MPAEPGAYRVSGPSGDWREARIPIMGTLARRMKKPEKSDESLTIPGAAGFDAAVRKRPGNPTFLAAYFLATPWTPKLNSQECDKIATLFLRSAVRRSKHAGRWLRRSAVLLVGIRHTRAFADAPFVG